VRRGHQRSHSSRKYERVGASNSARSCAGRKPAHPEEQRSRRLSGAAEQLQRQPLGEQGERELVAFVTECRRERLVKRFVRSVQLHELRERCGFSPEAELRRSEQDLARLLLRQIAQRSETAARFCLRHLLRTGSREPRRIHTHLRHEAVLRGAGEKLRRPASVKTWSTTAS
jgi:hypothetical protein